MASDDVFGPEEALIGKQSHSSSRPKFAALKLGASSVHSQEKQHLMGESDLRSAPASAAAAAPTLPAAAVLPAIPTAAAASAAAAGTKQFQAKPNALHRRASTGFIALGGPRVPPVVPRASFGSVDTYKKLEKLGEGTYATVYKGISAVNGKMVALKEIRLEQQEGAPCTAIREVSLLKGLKHANIVTLHDIIYNKSVLMLVFEYLEKDLKIYMDDCGSFIDVVNIRLFLFQLLRGLQYCHSRKVLHRDLKPQNLLINSLGELKLADFGLARAKSVPIRTYSHEVVTLWYRPPDVLLGSVDYTTSIDIWGVGCILYEMVSGRAIFPGSDTAHQLRLIWHLLGTPSEDRWPGVSQLPEYQPGSYPELPRQDMAMYVPRLDRAGIDLLNRMLQYDPRTRISGTDALSHRYFDVLGAARDLPNDASIFSVPSITFHPDLRMRPHVPAARKKGADKRRSSVRF